LACEAGGSIKPGVERGFASATPGAESKLNLQAHEMGDSTLPGNRQHLVSINLSPAFAGLKICCALSLGLTPQALCFRLLRRLKIALVRFVAKPVGPVSIYLALE